MTPGAKAFEKLVFGPCTLVRTWGTRPARSQRDCGLFSLVLTLPFRAGVCFGRPALLALANYWVAHFTVPALLLTGKLTQKAVCFPNSFHLATGSLRSVRPAQECRSLLGRPRGG